MYIWLKDIVTDDQLQGLLGDVKADTSRNAGRKYISIYGDVFDPTTDVPNIPDELIEKVTYKDRIYRGFRTEGVYRHEGAEMVVKTEVKVHSEMMADTIEREEYQEINVSAPSIEALKAIYTLVRQGKLAPEENWEQDVLDVPRATTPAETEEKATT